MKYRLFALTVVLIGCAALVRAQQPLRLQIAAGRVTLHAQNVPVRTILTEWARLGGAKIVNGDRVVGAPLTLDLENVPERQALDIILRGVSGYMLAAREPGAAGASMYDRIMILPTSAAPRTPAPTTPGPILPNAPGLGRPIGPPRVPGDQDDNDGPNGVAGNDDGVPVPRPVALRPTPNPTGFNSVPLPPIGTPEETPPKTAPGVVSTPANPFGVPPGSSTMPGVIAPPPPASPPPNRTGPVNATGR
jgi:hypothetical protein